MRLQVHLQRTLARIHFYDPQQSDRTISAATGISVNTVRSFRNKLKKANVSWDTLEPLDDEAWCTLLQTADHSIAKRKAAPEWAHIHEEMQRPDATLEFLWREWKAQCPDGLSYSQFTHNYREWKLHLHIVMRRVHPPGEKLFVDFAGRTMTVVDAHGGPDITVQIFVAVLGYSNYTYIEGVLSQTTADWIQCHVNCFAAFGGVPEWVVPDNLKAAVWRRERDRIVINPAYQECLQHYNTVPLPAGARKPKHKAKVEVGVQIAQRWVLFALRDRVFFSLEELNQEIRRLTALLNQHPFKKMSGTRLDRFMQKELPALKPLPATPFELCDWRYQVRVGHDYFVEHQASFYSVPETLRGHIVDLRFTSQSLEVMHRGRRVALHAIATQPGSVVTLEEHRPVIHRRVLEGEPKALLAWAQSVGSHTERMIGHHLQDRKDLTNGIKAARDLRELARLYGNVRFEEVCAYALPLNMTAVRNIKSILKQSIDKNDPTDQTTTQPAHENVRGPKYYGDQS